MKTPGTPIVNHSRVTEQQLVMADMYSKSADAPVMAIAFIRSIHRGQIEPEWMKHHVLNYVKQLAYLERDKIRKQNRIEKEARIKKFDKSVAELRQAVKGDNSANKLLSMAILGTMEGE